MNRLVKERKTFNKGPSVEKEERRREERGEAEEQEEGEGRREKGEGRIGVKDTKGNAVEVSYKKCVCIIAYEVIFETPGDNHTRIQQPF